MSRILKSVLALAFVTSLVPVNLAGASDLSPEQLADARARVSAAATLAAIGKAENDGDLLIAVRIFGTNFAPAMPITPTRPNTASATIAAAAARRPARPQRASRREPSHARSSRIFRLGGPSFSLGHTKLIALIGIGARLTAIPSSRPTRMRRSSGRNISTVFARADRAAGR